MWKLTINGCRIGFFEIQSHAEMLAHYFGATDFSIVKIDFPVTH